MSNPKRKSRSKDKAGRIVLAPVATLRPHRCAELVPRLARPQAAALAADIRAHGVLKPLEVTSDGVVLDGHERLAIARSLGLEHVPTRLVEADDERAYILGAALFRKHLNPGQRALLALDLDSTEQERIEARARQRANLKQNADVANLPPRGEKTRDRIAKRIGVSARIVQDAETVRAGDPSLCAQVKQGAIRVSNAAQTLRQARRDAELGSPPPLPVGPFELVYADPPWKLGNAVGDRAPENHFPTMELAEIVALQPPVAADAILYLWAVNMLLPEALQLIEAWGFRYITNLVWVKPSIGLGNWARHRHELLLAGRRGAFSPPDPDLRPGSVIEAPRGRHSQKPAEVYELLEHAHPLASKLELFARNARPGWTAWGNEVPR
jgi:N6-adenosine-specific RNA methylase IME4